MTAVLRWLPHLLITLIGAIVGALLPGWLGQEPADAPAVQQQLPPAPTPAPVSSAPAQAAAAPTTSESALETTGAEPIAPSDTQRPRRKAYIRPVSYVSPTYDERVLVRWIDVAVSVSVSGSSVPLTEYEREVGRLRSGDVSFVLPPNAPHDPTKEEVRVVGASVTRLVTRRIPANDIERFEFIVNGTVKSAQSLSPAREATAIHASVHDSDSVILALYSPRGVQHVSVQ